MEIMTVNGEVPMDHSWDLMIFSVAPRAHLLRDTYRSFISHCQQKFHRVILSIAGWDDAYLPVIKEINPDILLWDRDVPGYYLSAKRAVRETQASYVFWMEDDYTFHRVLPFDEVEGLFALYPDLCQVCLPRGAKPLVDATTAELCWMYATVTHFSNGPFIRRAFNDFLPEDLLKNDSALGIEQFLGRAMKALSPGVKVAILSNMGGRFLTHIGSLYSSPREAVSVSNELSSRVKISVGDAHMIPDTGDDSKSNAMKTTDQPAWRKIDLSGLWCKVYLHGSVIIRFVVQSLWVLLSYGRSREIREFVFRSVQYFKHSP